LIPHSKAAIKTTRRVCSGFNRDQEIFLPKYYFKRKHKTTEQETDLEKFNQMLTLKPVPHTAAIFETMTMGSLGGSG